MKRTVVLLTIVFGLAVLAVAADVSGQWVAQVPGRGGDPTETTFNFKVDGSTLTGSVATPRGERPIENGKVSGDEISFTQTFEFGGNTMKILYKGKLAGDEIKFTRQREGGEGQAREFTAKRK